jgi:hypothetical protein
MGHVLVAMQDIRVSAMLKQAPTFEYLSFLKMSLRNSETRPLSKQVMACSQCRSQK